MPSEKDDLSPHIQDSIAFLSIMSTEFLRLTRAAVKPNIFSSEVVSLVVKACYAYYDLTKQAPGDHICDALNDSLRGHSQEKRELAFTFLERVSEMKAPNVDYVISKVSKFVKTREFELAALEFVKLVDRQEFTSAEQLMFTALRAGVAKENIGCDYFVDFGSMKRQEDFYLMKTGITELDRIRVGFKRKELVCILGGYKGKKSFACHHFGKTALLHGLNVLHVSHENEQEEVEERYDRMSGSLTGWDKQNCAEVGVYVYDKPSGKVHVDMIRRPNITDIFARKAARRALQRFGGRLIIRKFAMGACDMREFERLLDYLEAYESFVPDVIINDYPDIMKLDPTKQTRDALNDLYISHKRICDERNCLGFVPSQATREAIRSKRLRMKDFAEDIRKLANVDTALGVCQSDAQAEASVGTIYVVAARKGEMDRGCNYVQNLDIGQFCTDSWPARVGKDSVDVDDGSEKEAPK